MKTLFPANVYKKFVEGEHLTNAELAYGARYFNEVGDQLFVCGPTFALAAKEAHRVGRTLEEFILSRARK